MLTKPDESIYYDPNKTLSKQRLFNFIVGARGCGKTYGYKRHVIRTFIKRGEQFVYIRRYETEFPSAEIRNFFEDIQDEFPEHEFKVYNGIFYIDKSVAGWYIALSKAVMLKSIPFPNVTMIIFDEFIIETGVYRYLPNEVRAFLDCYNTISRDRDVTAVFLSNAITMSNPYFLYFDVKFEKGQNVFLTEFISVEIFESRAYEAHIANTKFGRMISSTEYGRYAMQNKFLLDTDTFLEKMPPGCSYICTFIIVGKNIGYYVNAAGNMWYLSEKVDSTCPRRFTLDMENHTEETILSAKNNLYIANMINHFCQGFIRFDTQTAKNICNSTLKKLV